MSLDAEKLGIWGNEECLQCGACCYDMHMSIYGKLCKNKIIQNGKSYCKIHDEEERAFPECSSWFCAKLRNPLIDTPDALECIDHKIQRYTEIASELGTRPSD